jgi:glycosyltransferase involved in cell wall biosynthesis
LSGRHALEPATTEPGPRAEFGAFLDRFGGELLSASSLDGPLPPIAGALKRAGQPRLALASLVQSRAKQFDAIIASGEDIGVPIALASLAGFSRTPIHMMFHGHHLDSPKLRLLGPALRRLPHVHFHCLSDSLREQIQTILGIPASRCHATGYGVDTNYFAGGLVSDPPVIASAGAANRDYATLAAAVCDLPISVCIAADSKWVSSDTPDEPMDWPANVEARSYGCYARLRELYARAQFVVVPLHPARHACGYAVIAEAMAMGRAVIATRTEVPPDFLIPAVTGLLVEPNDIEGLRLSIRHLLKNPAEAAAIGERARTLMVETNSLERYADRLEKIVSASITKSYQETARSP